jgi:hypothetical protein
VVEFEDEVKDEEGKGWERVETAESECEVDGAGEERVEDMVAGGEGDGDRVSKKYKVHRPQRNARTGDWLN